MRGGETIFAEAAQILVEVMALMVEVMAFLAEVVPFLVEVASEVGGPPPSHFRKCATEVRGMPICVFCMAEVIGIKFHLRQKRGVLHLAKMHGL